MLGMLCRQGLGSKSYLRVSLRVPCCCRPLFGHLLSEFARPLGGQEDEREIQKSEGMDALSDLRALPSPLSIRGFFFLLSCLIDLETDVPGCLPLLPLYSLHSTKACLGP